MTSRPAPSTFPVGVTTTGGSPPCPCSDQPRRTPLTVSLGSSRRNHNLLGVPVSRCYM